MQNDLLASTEAATRDTRITLMEGIIHKRAVTATYNRQVIKLAPHQLFERGGDLFVSALNLSKAWRSAEEERLGQFKLMGLSAAELLDEPFEPLPAYDGSTPWPDDVLVLTI